MTSLALSPDWTISKVTRLTPFEQDLGDGYQHHSGITAYRPRWNATRVYRPAQQREAEAALALLRQLRGDTIFQWSPGFGIPEENYYCQSWSSAVLGEDGNGQQTIQIKAEFERDIPPGLISVGDDAELITNYPIAPFTRGWAIEVSESPEVTRVEFRGGVVDRDRKNFVHPIVRRMRLEGPVADFGAVDAFFQARGGKPFRIQDDLRLWRCNEWTLTPEGNGNSCQAELWRFSGEIRQVFRAVDDTDTAPPAAVMKPIPDITTGTGFAEVEVTYSDPGSGIDTGTIGNDDIRVFGPNGYAEFGSLQSIAGNVATYAVVAPGGAWDQVDNGSYTVEMQPSEVADQAGNFIPTATLGSFLVNVPAPDTTPPVGALVGAGDIASPNQTSTITVQFTDPPGSQAGQAN